MSRPVALIGPQGAGKTTLAELLVEHRGYRRHGIADGIRRVLQMAYRDGVSKGETIDLQRFSGKVTGSSMDGAMDLSGKSAKVTAKKTS